LDLSNAAETKTPERQARIETVPDFVNLADKLAPVVVNVSTTQNPSQRGAETPTPPAPHPFGAPDPFGGNDPLGEFWRRFFGDQFGMPRAQPQRGLGSGFIIDTKGLVVTNNHVVENADKIRVKLSDEREFSAKLIGRDPQTDIAVIQISDGKGGFPCRSAW